MLTLSLTDFAIPAILGGGTQDFIANAIYDQFFRTSDQGLGATLALLLVAVGSMLVGIVFALFGAGTLGHGRRAPMTAAASKTVVLWAVVASALVMLSAPTLVVLGASFTAGNIIAFPPEGLSLKWYAAIAGARDLARRLPALALCRGDLHARSRSRSARSPASRWPNIAIRFEKTIQIYLLLPFTIPLIGSGIGLMLVFGELGVLGQLWPVGIACCVINLPFMIWAVTASATALDPDLELAAANCGAPPL